MAYDFKTNHWQYDINSFGRYKNMFNIIAHHQGEWADRHREWIRTRLREIQQRWPQFIKEDEIP